MAQNSRSLWKGMELSKLHWGFGQETRTSKTTQKQWIVFF